MKKKINPIKYEKRATTKKAAPKKQSSAKKQKKFKPIFGLLRGSVLYEEDLTEPLDLSWNANTNES